jgi:hypothetical protein
MGAESLDNDSRAASLRYLRCGTHSLRDAPCGRHIPRTMDKPGVTRDGYALETITLAGKPRIGNQHRDC